MLLSLDDGGGALERAVHINVEEWSVGTEQWRRALSAVGGRSPRLVGFVLADVFWGLLLDILDAWLLDGGKLVRVSNGDDRSPL